MSFAPALGPRLRPPPSAYNCRVQLTGIFPPLTTPFDDYGNLLLDRLRDNVDRYNHTPLPGYVALGSTGEAIYLTTEEKLEVLRVISQATKGKRTLIAGTGEESLRATVAMTQQAADLGYQAALVRTPHYYKGGMTAAAQLNFYRLVADASPIPVLIYNFPQLTGLDLTVETVTELAAHPNICGIKESSGSLEKLTRLLHATAPAHAGHVKKNNHPHEGGVAVADAAADFNVLPGNAATLYPSLCAGAPGAILALAVPAPKACWAVFEDFQKSDHAAALRHQGTLLEAAVTCAQLGVAAIKYALDRNGFYGGPPRLPLMPLSPALQERVTAAFATVRG